MRLDSDAAVGRLTICDDGPGIPADQRDRVFDRFTRVDDTRARGAAGTRGGTGLGLSIARVIADRHHGSIRVVSPPGPGVGACLVIELPLAPSQVQRTHGLA